MSFLDTIKAAVASPQAQFNIFLIEYKPNGKTIFSLIEGREDPAFYRRFVVARAPAGYRMRLVGCGNRKKVIESVDAFLARYPADPKVLAFIDKDHSDLVPGSLTTKYPFCYQTECYSIENYVCESEVVRRFCVETLGMPDLDPACDQIAAHFTKVREQFATDTMRLMAWIVASRRRGDSLNVNNIEMSTLFRLDENLVAVPVLTGAQQDRYLEQVTGANAPTPPVPEADIDDVIVQLQSLTPKQWLRGKQELWLTVSFINKLAPAVKLKGVRAGSRVMLNASNALDLLSAKCDAPGRLDAFLTATFAGLS